MLPARICNFRAFRYFLYEQINLAGMLVRFSSESVCCLKYKDSNMQSYNFVARLVWMRNSIAR